MNPEPCRTSDSGNFPGAPAISAVPPSAWQENYVHGGDFVQQPNGGALITFPNPDDVLPTDSLDEPALGASENFPIDSFPSKMRMVVEEIAAVHRTPVCLPAMSALAMLSGAVGTSAVVVGAYKNKQTRLNIFVWVVAERGSGKGNIGEELAKPIFDYSQKMIASRKTDVSKCNARLSLLKKRVAHIENEAAKTKVASDDVNAELATYHEQIDGLKTEIERRVGLWISNATSEALACSLYDNNETLFSYSSEAGAIVKVVLGKYTKQNQGDFDLLLSAYSGDAVKVDRVGRNPIELRSPCLASLWMVQPIVLRDIAADQEAFSRGLTARPLIFDSGARREFDDGKTLQFTGKVDWAKMINDVLNQRFSKAPPRSILCTGEARQQFTDFFNESVKLERGPCADVTGELSRWRENAIKVAGLFALAEHATSVTADLAERAIRVVRWCGYNYLSLLRAGRRDRLAKQHRRLLEILQDNGGAVNIGVLNRNHHMKRAEVEAIAATFPESIMIEKMPQTGAGRPAEIVRTKGFA